MAGIFQGKEIKAVVFDFDQTLYSAVLLQQMWKEIRRELHATLPKEEQLSLEKFEELGEKIGWGNAYRQAGGDPQLFNEKATSANKAECLSYDSELVDILQKLIDEQIELYIFTGSNRASVLVALAVLVGKDLAKFFENKLLANDDMEAGTKPSIEAYKEMVERFGINPNETLYIDDHKAEILAAIEMGFLTIKMINEEESSDDCIADECIRSIHELLNILEIKASP